jgi:hypothetical protein
MKATARLLHKGNVLTMINPLSDNAEFTNHYLVGNPKIGVVREMIRLDYVSRNGDKYNLTHKGIKELI